MTHGDDKTDISTVSKHPKSDGELETPSDGSGGVVHMMIVTTSRIALAIALVPFWKAICHTSKPLSLLKQNVMKIHYLQHVPFEGLASIESWALNHHHALSVTRFYANDPIPYLDDIDWLIVMGGPMNIYEEAKYPWLIEEKRFIARAIEQNKTVVGICLGAQLIADVLGAKVYRGQHKEIGWFPIEKTADAECYPVFASLPQTFNVFHWHGDTFDIPQGATRLAYSKGCQNQAFIYGDNVLGLQFHLESTRDSVKKMIEHCVDELTEGEYVQTSKEMFSRSDRFAAINTAMSSILNKLKIKA